MVSQMGTQRAPALSQVANEVTSLERQWIEAALHRDIAVLDHLLADSFIITSTLGIINKKQCIENIDHGELTIESISRDDTTLHDYGDEAVVNGVATIKGQYRGHDISGQYRYRHTLAYVQWPGRWQVVSGQVHRIK